MRTILKKISTLNQKAASGLHNALLLIEGADTLDKYATIKPRAALALKFLVFIHLPEIRASEVVVCNIPAYCDCADKI
ncbi:MAG: hypothetical protein QXR48_02160 [Candidatus Woesearchaeota archaeon]